MQLQRQILVWACAIVAAGSSCGFASGGGSMGGGAGFSGSMPRSPQDPAVDAYNAGVYDIGKAKDLEGEAVKAPSDEKKTKALAKSQKLYGSALEQFQKAVAKNPSLFQAWNYVGFCQRHLGRYEDALAAYAKALELNPRYGEAYEYRAEAYLGLNRIEEAKASYMQLFNTARPLADQLMASMRRWIEDRQKDAKGVTSDELTSFANWIDERAAIAQQTASLWLGAAGKNQVDWN